MTVGVWTAATMRAADREVIDGLGVPGVALMEVASAGLARAVQTHHLVDASRGVLVLCGPGNNGGDGYGAARHLHRAGVPVSTWSLSPTSSGDAAVMREAARRVGVPEVTTLGTPGLVVDALFGTGLTRPLTGDVDAVLAQVAALGVPVVAADLPSGLHADTGAALGRALTCVRTVTFGGFKLGMFSGLGPRVCGEVEVIDLGLDVASAPARRLGRDLPQAGWPRRDPFGSKVRSGRVLVVAGSARMAGAAVLACRAALASGAGLVTLLTARGALVRLGALPPEVMVLCAGDDVWDGTLPDLSRYDAVAAGPGLGGGEPLSDVVLSTLSTLWATSPLALVFDADALVATGAPQVSAPRVLTPHAGEAGRLLGCPWEQVEADRLAAVSTLAARGTVVLKGPHSLVGSSGLPVAVNQTGGPALSTGGTGDVLTGMVGALLARGLSAHDAACAAVVVHGMAGELAGVDRGEAATASDVIAGVVAFQASVSRADARRLTS